MKPQFIFDLDDVSVDMIDKVHRILNPLCGQEHKPEDFYTYDFLTMYPGFEKPYLMEALVDAKAIETANPLEGAVEATHLIREAGGEVNIVTARRWHPNAESATEAYLERKGFYFDRLRVTGYQQPKSEAYKHIAPQFELMVDDSPSHLTDALETGIVNQVAMIEKPWNAAAKHPRHSSLLNVVQEYLSR
ncbi:hypothetical protein [Neptuniibacter sp. QD37_11]|uniref:hypothetical protein n=1 Tax=Neptuniibacter sp. QD37_11 TaxID=3398209 RepID=UPI0039F550BF